MKRLFTNIPANILFLIIGYIIGFVIGHNAGSEQSFKKRVNQHLEKFKH